MNVAVNVDIMERTKETAVADFLDFIKKSWTWKKLTDKEKKSFIDTVEAVSERGVIKGTYTSRWNIVQSLYSMFLSGCGYEGGNWRD